MVGKLSTMLFAWAVFLTLAGMALAQERIRIAWAGASPANAGIWVLQEKKLLQKYGVEPEIISISASPIVLQTLLAGEIDVSAISVTTLVSSRLAGADTVMILGMVRTFVDHIFGAKHHQRRPAQRQDRRRQPYRQHVGHGAALRLAA